MHRTLDPSLLRRVLVVQTAFPGDVLLTIPLVRAIRFAGAEFIMVATTPATADCVRENISVDELFLFDKRGSHRSIRATWTAGRGLRHLGLTSVFVPHRSFRSAVFARGTDVPIRVGFNHSAGQALFTHRVPHHAALPETHRNLSLLSPFAIEQPMLREPWFVAPANRDAQREIRIVIAPGSQWGTKRWPPQSFTRLIEQCLGNQWSIVVTGSGQEVALCSELCRPFAGRDVKNTAGETSWQQFQLELSSATLIVSNDSATVHAANIVGTPVVALFGPTVPEFGFAPRGSMDAVVEVHRLICRPCSPHGAMSCPVGTHACMNDLSVDMVMEAVRNIIKAQHASK